MGRLWKIHVPLEWSTFAGTWLQFVSDKGPHDADIINAFREIEAATGVAFTWSRDDQELGRLTFTTSEIWEQFKARVDEVTGAKRRHLWRTINDRKPRRWKGRRAG